MSSISSEEIISILKSEIENFDVNTKDEEVGTVILATELPQFMESTTPCMAKSSFLTPE